MNKLTLIYKSLCGHTFSFFFGENPDMGLRGHVARIGLTIHEAAKLVPKLAAPLYSSAWNVREVKLLHIFANTWH